MGILHFSPRQCQVNPESRQGCLVIEMEIPITR